MDSVSMIIAAFAAVFVILLLVYFFMQQAEHKKRANRFEKAIEEANKEIYKLSKKFKEFEVQNESARAAFRTQIYQDFRIELKNTIEASIANAALNTRNQSDALRREMNELQQKIESKVARLDEQLREMSYIPSSSSIGNNDEQKIISLRKDGWSVDAIAKEMRIGKGEVEFILKFANM